jgi:integrase
LRAPKVRLYIRVRFPDGRSFYADPAWNRNRTLRAGYAVVDGSQGVPPTRIHRLRHTFATWLANAGMDIMQLKELLGHSSIATTLQYTKIMDTTLARG